MGTRQKQIPPLRCGMTSKSRFPSGMTNKRDRHGPRAKARSSMGRVFAGLKPCAPSEGQGQGQIRRFWLRQNDDVGGWMSARCPTLATIKPSRRWGTRQNAGILRCAQNDKQKQIPPLCCGMTNESRFPSGMTSEGTGNGKREQATARTNDRDSGFARMTTR